MKTSTDRGVQPEPKAASVPPIKVPTHGSTRYIRVRLGVDDGVMWWELPRTLLGVVPIGVRRIAVPVAEVRSLQIRHRVRPLNLVVGLACLAAPAAFGTPWAALPLGVAGLWVVVVSLGPSLDAVTHEGRTYRADVCFGHEIDADLYMTAVHDLMAASDPGGPEAG